MIQDDWTDEQVEEHILGLPIWRNDASLEPLVGGLCNRSYVVRDGDKTYVARVGFDILLHGITQTSVQTSMIAASEIGIAPRFRYAEPNLTVVDFLDGGCLTSQNVLEPETLDRIVARVKTMHEGSNAIHGPLTYFWPFQVVRHYVKVGFEKTSRLKPELPELERIATVLEKAVGPFVAVFTHNDLVPQNFMFDANKEVYLVDWDYGGYGHPLLDLAAVGANADSTETQDRAILDLYYGQYTDALWREFIALRLILNLREYMWGMVQEVTSRLAAEAVKASMATIYPDREQGYEGYTNLNRERFEKAWQAYRGEYDRV